MLLKHLSYYYLPTFVLIVVAGKRNIELIKKKIKIYLFEY